MAHKLLLGLILVAGIAQAIAGNHNPAPISRPDESDTLQLIFFENFEHGAQDWQTVDLTATTTWHLDDYNAYGGSGLSFWSGDTLLAGYDNLTLQYLETPTINLSGAVSPVLEFDAFWAVELPLGEFPPGYDGWDGVNVWVSTDGGANWQVLLVQTPSYNCSSIGSFGIVWGMGPNIAGWAGFSGGVSPGSWVHVTANMAAYISATVKLRFALASDEEVCTRNVAAYTGFFVDNLDLHDATTHFLQNTGEPGVLVPSSGEGNIGNFWHIVDLYPDSLLPSPFHVMRLSDPSESYIPRINNALVTPVIDLTEYSEDSVMVRANFYLRGSINVNDTASWPYLDYVTLEVTPDEGVNWYNFNTPWGQGTDQRVLTFAFVNYLKFSDLIGDTIDLSPYCGENIRLRIRFQSDADSFAGEGLFVDNFWIETDDAVGVIDPPAAGHPTEFALRQNSPNPFNPGTSIRFDLPAPTLVSLSVYDVGGCEVAKLARGWYNAGSHQVTFNGSGLASGIYIYRLTAGNHAAAGKMILLK